MYNILLGFATFMGYVIVFLFVVRVLLEVFTKGKTKSSKELYDEEIIKRKTQAIKDGEYTFDYRSSDNIYVNYGHTSGLSNDKFSTDFNLFQCSQSSTSDEKDVLINGRYYETSRASMLASRHQLIIQKGKEDYRNERELLDKKIKAQRIINDAAEEVKWAKKYTQLMGTKQPSNAAANKIKREFQETFDKANRLLTIADEIQNLVEEAKGIRYNK